MLRKFFILISWSLLGLGVLLTGVLISLLSDEPVVISTKSTNPKAFLEMKNELRGFIKKLNSKSGSKVLVLNHSQVEELFATTSHIIPSLAVNYNHSGNILIAAGSLKLPEIFLGKYLNITVEFINQSSLLDGTTNIGHLTLSNNKAYKIAIEIAARIIDRDIAYTIGHLIETATYDDKVVSLLVDESIDSRLLIARLKSNVRTFGDLFLDRDDYASVTHYHNLLLELYTQIRGIDQQISLYDYLVPLMQLAYQRSINESTISENVNAILALGLFAGEYDLKTVLEQITGVRSNSIEPEITLGGRQDLAKHFLYSAIIQLFSNSELSFSIGELKEISDLEFGGSGFSFADLAADRAGIHFIERATANDTSARNVQTYLIGSNSEGEIFPDITGLEEKLSLYNFDRKYQDINTDQYKLVVKQIDQRIQALALYTSLR